MMATGAAHQPSMTGGGVAPAGATPPMRRTMRGVVRGIGAITVFGAFTAAMALLWERAFGFSAGEAWALSISLGTYIAMLVAVLVMVVVVVNREERATRS